MDVRRAALIVAGLLLAGALAACQVEETLSPSEEVHFIPGGDADRGWQLVQDYGCNTCHTIPGVPNADALVGPPLTAWADRQFIAGSLINNAENLMLWIRQPQTIEPGTAMPDMGVTEQDARDIGAYLFTLERNHD